MRMLTRRALSLVLAILWLWPASLHAQSEALMEAYRQGKALETACWRWPLNWRERGLNALVRASAT